MPRYQLHDFLNEWAAEQQALPPEMSRTMRDLGVVPEPEWRRWRALLTREIIAD